MAVLGTLRRPVHTIELILLSPLSAASVLNVAGGPLGGVLFVYDLFDFSAGRPTIATTGGTFF